MAFARSGLHKLTENLFRYNAAADTAATVTASGYFSSVTDELKQDDVILVISGNRAAVDVIVVASATGAATVTTVVAEGVA